MTLKDKAAKAERDKEMQEWKDALALAEDMTRTSKVLACTTMSDLRKVVKELGPFISYSRPDAKVWGAEKILLSIIAIRQGAAIEHMTRVNGLRAKVAELVLANNYGQPWDEA
jgi:hypothetical protein